MRIPFAPLIAGACLLAASAAAQPATCDGTGPAAAQACLEAAGREAQGHGQAAFADVDRARTLFHEAGDARGEGIALFYAGVGYALLNTPEGNAKAIDAYRLAIPLLQAAHDEADLVIVQGRLGLAELRAGRLAEARTQAEAALPLLTGPANAIARSNALFVQGSACEGQQDWPCAGDAFAAMADILHAANPPLETTTHARAALDLQRLGMRLRPTDAQAAAAAFARAADQYRAAGDNTAQSIVLMQLSLAKADMDDLDGALAADEAALAAAGDGPNRGFALHALAADSLRRGRYPAALDYAKQALPLFPAPERAAQRASVLLEAGNAAAGIHDNASALRYLEQAQGFAAANPSVAAAALAAEGEIATDAGDPARGAELARQAMAQHQSLGLPEAANKDRNDLGLALSAMGRRAEALATFEQSLAEAHDPQQQGASLSNLAMVHQSFGDFTEAASLYRRARDAARRAGDQDAETAATNGLAMVEHALGDEQAALADLEAAIKLSHDAGNRRTEAIAMSDLALVRSAMGEPQAALDTLARTRAIFAAMDDSYHEAATADTTGSIYRGLGALDEAKRYFQQAIEIDERTHDQDSLSTAINNRAVVEQTQDHLDEAEADLQRVLDIQTALGNRIAQLSVLSNLAMVYDAGGDDQRALDLLSRSLTLAEAIGNVEGQALTLHNRGTVREHLHDLDGARADIERALPIWDQIGAVPNLAMAHSVLAHIEAAQGRTDEALGEVQKSIALDESQRGRIASEDLRASFLANAGRAYALRTELLMRLDAKAPGQGYAAQALEATEAGRSRSLLDLLADAQAQPDRRADPAQAGRLRAVRGELSAKLTKLASLGRDSPDGQSLAREIDDLTAEQDRLEAALRAADSVLSPAPLQAAQIQALLDPETVLLDYALGDDRGFVWLVTPNSLRAAALPGRATVLAAVRAMRTTVTGPGADTAAFAPAAETLGRILLGPVAADIAGKRLVIVADAPLQARVPFAALTIPPPSPEAGQKLIEAHELVIEPSAAALAAIRARKAGRTDPPDAVAVFADPVVSADDPRLGGRVAGPNLILAEGSLPRLPATQKEADAILAAAGPERALVRTGFQATREAAQDPDLARYRILHIATHGITDTSTPAASGLVFSLFRPDGRAVDGYLRLADVFGLSLPADLVVLSACGSALGRETGGEGLIGLSRGFFQAGASSLVASLWEVRDDSTAELMARFYGAMLGKDHLRPAAALRAAQLDLLRSEQWRAPSGWAAFTVQGEWR